MNGYKNFETWNCYNWLTADESSVFKWEKAAKEALETGGGRQRRSRNNSFKAD